MTVKFTRQLTKTEVRYGFIYIDDDGFRQVITGEDELVASTPAGIYSLRLDKEKRLGRSKNMFKNNNFRPRDVISLTKKNNTIIVSKVS